ncbi:ATP-binding protein [Streptomyces sp. TR02-1]|uniref:sensor histidine kinase n=1 Tax=Streptomyces sp. TR02-1 TaxID=3385977 RepID=UPI0039A0D9A6
MSDSSTHPAPARRHRGRRAKPRALIAKPEAQLRLLALLPLLTIGTACMGTWLTWNVTAIEGARTWTAAAVAVLVCGSATMIAAHYAKALNSSHKRLKAEAQHTSEHIGRVQHWLQVELWPHIRRGRQFLPLQQQPPLSPNGTQPAANPYAEFSAALQAFVDDSQRAVERAAAKDHSEITKYVTKRLHSTVRQALDWLYELNRKIEDPPTMDLVFEVDQRVTKMRRFIESLAIIGGDRPRRQEQNTLTKKMVRSAVSEVQNEGRVRRIPGRDSAVLGYAVPDLIHLLAELVENAVRYSPPEQDVEVKPTHVPNGLSIEIDDVGLPIGQTKLMALNRVLDPATPTEPQDTQYIGLGMRVVAEIARRYGVDVHLGRNRKGGNRALVIIPKKLLATGAEDEETAVHPAGPPATTPQHTAAVPPPPRLARQRPAARPTYPEPQVPSTSREPMPRRAAEPTRSSQKPRLPRRSEAAGRGPMSDMDLTRPAEPPPVSENPGRIAGQYFAGRYGSPSASHQNTAQEDQT